MLHAILRAMLHRVSGPLESSGISDIWAESEVFGETTAENILKGKLWNRVVRAHKLSYEALWRVLWPILTSWAKDNGKDDALADLSRRFAFQFDKNSGMDTAAYSSLIDEVGQVTDIVKQFDGIYQDVLLLEAVYAHGLYLAEVHAGHPRGRLGTLSVVVCRDASLVCRFRSCQLHKMGNSFSGRHEAVTMHSSRGAPRVPAW